MDNRKGNYILNFGCTRTCVTSSEFSPTCCGSRSQVYSSQNKVIVVGFDTSNGGGAHEDVACTITTGGNAGAAVVQPGESPTIGAGEIKSFGRK